MTARVVAVHLQAEHRFSKDTMPAIDLVAGRGVRGDAHCGVTVQHRSRVARDPTQPNLRQVHLMHAELFAELAAAGLHVEPGQLGENITTEGLALLDLGAGTVLRVGPRALVQVTGLRNPCAQIEAFKPGLLAAVLDKSPGGVLVRKAGIMGIVLESGPVSTGDAIAVQSVPARHAPLQPV
ncbi:MAG: MOSC domain-containing protein [Rubrivivax sp.]|jgi:MOSC domain-containing protein YiiM|nr:MOSC domain-containing protein [Rubrivivax sp.]